VRKLANPARSESDGLAVVGCAADAALNDVAIGFAIVFCTPVAFGEMNQADHAFLVSRITLLADL
jgi:hypothetical protein